MFLLIIIFKNHISLICLHVLINLTYKGICSKASTNGTFMVICFNLVTHLWNFPFSVFFTNLYGKEGVALGMETIFPVSTSLYLSESWTLPLTISLISISLRRHRLINCLLTLASSDLHICLSFFGCWIVLL